jgi:prepilin-type processing-associated H-X9-DG protein
MKHRFFSCCAIPFILIFIAAFAIIYPVWQRAEYNLYNPDFYCQSNLKQIGLAIFMYAEDYDENLPPAIFPGKTVGWADGIQPYIKSYPILKCPREKYQDDHSSLTVEIKRFFGIDSSNSQEENPQPDKAGFTDYWLNRNLSGVNENNFGKRGKLSSNKNVSYPEQIIMLGDGDGKSPQSTASYSIDQLPVLWRKSTDSPAKRHKGGANYTFLDGHVKWLKPEQVSQLPTSKKHPVYTFSVR